MKLLSVLNAKHPRTSLLLMKIFLFNFVTKCFKITDYRIGFVCFLSRALK